MSGGKATVIVKGRGFRIEGAANSTVQPGDLVQLRSDGKYERHSTAGGNAKKSFAVENELFGKGIDTNYAVGDWLLAEDCHSGMDVQVNIAADAGAILEGDFLESAGDGTLKKVTAASQSGTTPFAFTPAGVAIAQALEACDNSAGATIVQMLVRLL